MAYLAREGRSLAPQVYPVPSAIDEEVARRKLAAMNLAIDSLTAAQQAYLRSWREGTA